MKNFQKKKEIRNFFQSKIFLIFLGIIFLVFFWNVIGIIGKMKETARNKKIVENKITELTKQKDKLTIDIQKLNTPKGVEENIRDKFGLAKEGEGMVVVVDDKAQLVVPDTSKSSGFFSFFTNLFK